MGEEVARDIAGGFCSMRLRISRGKWAVVVVVGGGGRDPFFGPALSPSITVTIGNVLEDD